ncbi:MAG: extracellular solute-binding protein [Eubacteriales bacterium]
MHFLKRKVIPIALIASMLALSLLSCAKDSGNTGTTSPDATTAQVTTEEGTKEYKANIPEGTDYEGREFKVLVNKSDIFVWGDVDFVAEEETGEAINDAVFVKNRNVEELLNIKIVPVQATDGGLLGTMKKSIMAQDQAFDIAFPNPMSASSLAQQGFLTDLNNIPNLDLTSPWWDQNAVKDLSVANKLFMVTGDIGTMYKKSIGVIMFNKKLMSDYDLGDPYAMMREKKWTIDTLISMAKSVSKDLDGDNKYTTADMYGLIYFQDMGPLSLIGGGVKFVEKDASDMPKLSFYSEKTNDIFAKLGQIFYDKSIAFSWSANSIREDAAFTMFQSNQSLLYYGELHAVASMRSMDTDFGILPMPLYDEAQESYHHCINPYAAPVLTVPSTNDNLEQTGYILDALGAVSKNILTPAYYDLTLKGKVIRDDESEASLDIILNTVNYDIGYLNNWGDISNMVMKVVNSDKLVLGSQYEAIESKVQAAMDKAVDFYESLD